MLAVAVERRSLQARRITARQPQLACFCDGDACAVSGVRTLAHFDGDRGVIGVRVSSCA